MNKITEAWKSLSSQTKRMLVIIVSVFTALIIAGIFLLQYGNKPQYTTLFTGLSSDEAQDVIASLQEDNIEYLYDGSTGTIKVDQKNADAERAALAGQGYPKSGFTYDMYINNSGIMATESDKKQYTLYDLQDRLGATIRLFDGVQDAKVTIAEGTEDTYALSDSSDENSIDATASAVITMERGQTLTEESADAIRNLIARSVQGMNFTNVSVFDASTMTEVGSSTTGSGVTDTAKDTESSIEAKVKNVLAGIYGASNVTVSVKGVYDTSSKIQENTTYTVPEKTDENERKGLLEKEQGAGTSSGTDTGNAAGVTGTDANADTPEYTTVTGTDGSSTYSNSSYERNYLYNTQKEQVSTDPGTLTDLTVAVVIRSQDRSVKDADLLNLVADAAGIARDNADSKITIVRTNPTIAEEAAEEAEKTPQEMVQDFLSKYWFVLAAAVLLLLLLLILLLVLRRRHRKKLAEQAPGIAEPQPTLASQEETEQQEQDEQEDNIGKMFTDAERELQKASNQHMAHGEQLKDSIGGFVDENPQVAAKLIQSWLRDGDDQGGARNKFGK